MMSTEPLSFGPEWLRNRSQESCSQSSIPIPRYQLAEHRYGREEMLALSGRLNPPPDSIKCIPSLYVEKAQVPLALIQMTEDETRQWNRGINSDAVLRVSGKAPVGGPPANIRGGSRGGSVDRGRGRGRGGYYSRGLSFEEAGEVGELRGGPRPERNEGPSLSASSFPRNIRPFDRSQSAISTERGWGERNGTDPGDWNGSHSPRKEFGTSRSFMNDNWRRHRTGMEDEDGWRTATGGRTEKWTRSSWREGEKEGSDVDRGGRSQQWEQRTRGGWDDGHHLQRRQWDEDNLPEWATENPSESGGSFDATGAFHGGGFSDEDEINGGTGSIRRDPRTRKMSEGSGSTNNPKRPQVSSTKKLSVDANCDSRKRLNEELSRQAQNQNAERLGSEVTTPTNSSSERGLPVNTQPSSSVGGSSVSDAPLLHGHERTNMSSVKQGVPNTTSSSNFVKSSGVDLRAESGGALCELRVARDVPQVSVPKQTAVSTAQSTSTTLPYRGFPSAANTSVGSQKPEDAWDQMPEDADHLVEKLMADDDNQEKRKLSQKPSTAEAAQPPSLQRAPEKWYYRDPQGQEQGPFCSNDMAEWYKSGYFKPTLLIRRSCDEHFSHLGDLIESWGMIPFLAPPHFKPSEPITASLPTTTQTSKSVPTLASPIDPESVLLEQYHFQMLQRQLMLSQQAAIQAAVHKLSQNDRWNTLSALEQQQLITQQVMSQPLDPYMNMLPGGLDQKNAIAQLLNQLQQSKMTTPPLVENKLATPMAPAPPQIPPLDPLQQMIQQMGGLQQPATNPILPQAMPIPAVPAPPTVTLGLPPVMHPAQTHPEDPATKPAPDPIQMLLRQLNASKPQVESLWSGNAHPLFGNNLSWMPRVSPPPGQMSTSIWDMQGKEIKTEQEIMEEQRRAAEERRLEELRKQEEERKRKEEEEQARLKHEEEVRKEVERRKEEQRKRAEEEKRQQEKEAKRKEEEAKKQEEEKKRLQEEEKKRKEEAKRLEEEARKQKEEAARRKEEEKKRKEEEKEKKRKLEEERRRLEEQRKKEEEEKKRQEEEEAARKKAEEDQARQQRRQAEALRKLQEQQQQRAKAAAWSQPVAPQPSLAEIQRQERDKKEREAKELQQMLAAQQSAAVAAGLQQAAADKSSLHLNWVGKRPTVNKVKSLAEIQAEEQEKIVKNQERERAERAQQQKDVPLPAMSSIWGSASQSLSWAQNNSSVWSNTSSGSGSNAAGNGGFWDDISLSIAKTAAPTPKNATSKPTKAGTAANKGSGGGGGGGNKAKGSKKDEAVVMKLFEQNVQRTDDFTQWCTKTLTELHASCVEIPTFVAFLRDIESPYEVKDYIRTYLGEGKEILEFSRQFLERRSKWRSMQRAVEEEDDMCTPAPAINPLSTDFTEVKGKGKKTKKNKMFRVDNRILGFNVTAAEDRFNVGDRHYVEEL